MNKLKFEIDKSITVQDIKVPYNCSITTVDITNDGDLSQGRLVAFNDTSHLGCKKIVSAKDQKLR